MFMHPFLCARCDANSTNDCALDCTGAWGGGGALDACDVCEGSNDCIICDAGTEKCTADEGCPTGCKSCAADSASLPGNTCRQCPNGKEPNSAGSSCATCSQGKAGSAGRCEPCSRGRQSSENFDECELCPAGKKNSFWNWTCSFCEPGYEPMGGTKGTKGTKGTMGGTSCTECSAGYQSSEAETGGVSH